MRDLLPEIKIDLAPNSDIVDPGAFFSDGTNEVWLEIGFGAGEHLAWQAARRPDVGFIGCEPYLNGVSALLSRIAAESLANVRIFPDDARLLLARLAADRISRLILLFPDPWPKKRHHKRRLVCPEIIARFADILVDGGEFRFVTDHPEFARWTLLHMLTEPRFRWLAESPRDWRKQPEDWLETRYEQKAREADRTPIFLRYVRLPRSCDGTEQAKNT
ncbi:MAG: tRNA (guanosine(46)-N7)-methyltransferase TrmB [Alphaproteobacteria bacterium]